MRAVVITVTAVILTCLGTVARADDVADVKAAEIAFNAAQNAGNIEGMFKLSLPDRTLYGSAGGALVEGWTEESKKRRQAEFDAGRKIDLRIEDLKVRMYGDTAVTTFYRVGTMKEIGGSTKQVRLRISGVWVRQRSEWKLAHRHESAFEMSNEVRLAGKTTAADSCAAAGPRSAVPGSASFQSMKKSW